MATAEGRSFSFRLDPLIIPGRNKDRRLTIPPSLNARVHWRERHRINSLWKEATFWACKKARIPKLKTARIELVHHTVFPRDRDNLYASVKAILDAIVLAKVIPDDKDACLDLSCRSVREAHKADEHIQVTITEIT